MSAYSQPTVVTVSATGTEFDLYAENIVYITANGNGSTITFMDNGAVPRQIVVDEAPSTISTDCQVTILVSDISENEAYINVDRIVDVIDYVVGDANSKIYYNAGGPANKIIIVEETRSAIRTAAELLITAAVGAYAELDANNEWTVAQIFDAPNVQSTDATVSAHAGGGQASATALTKYYNNVTTVTTAGDSVKLLTAVVGTVQIVKNNGATTLAVFPFSGDAINGGSVDASINLNPGDQLSFTATTTSNWETEGVESLGVLFLSTDMHAAKEVDHVVVVDATTTAATVGGKLTIAAGAGATSGAGGALVLNGGAGGTTGAGGAITFTSGAATNVTAGTGAASGAITVTVGVSATATTGTGGAGAAIAVTGKAGGAATGAAGIGGAGSVTSVTSGAGGAASDSSGGNAGAGGATSVTAGAGGAASGTGGAAGGVGGAASVVSGAGGAAAGTSAAGVGGAIAITSGAGGAKTGTGHAAGGAGGSITVTVGAGGATASNGTDAGGAAGTYTITGGAGGNASAGTGNGGKGGDIVLTPGAGGTSAGGTVGQPGFVVTGKAMVRKHATAAINADATATVAQVSTGYITSTSAAATAITLPTATAMATALGSVGQGTIFDFVVDNTGGSNTVTVAVGVGIVAAKQTSSGDTATDVLLTVAASATVGIGIFRLVFSSTTTAVLFRIG